MKKGILVLACITSLTSCEYQDAQSAMLTKSSSKLEEYREYTLNSLTEHNTKHPNCVLNKLYQAVEVMPIYWYDGDKVTIATVDKGAIYINKRIWRNKKEYRITLIHEAIHAKGICGADSIKQKEPICFLFNKPVYFSTDISKYIDEHLKEFK